MTMCWKKIRKIRIPRICGIIIVLTIYCAFLYSLLTRDIDFNDVGGKGSYNFESDTIIIGSAVCGGQSEVDVILTMIKSAILFRGKLHVHFLILCSETTKGMMKTELEIIKVRTENAFTYELQEPFFPEENSTVWRDWYRPCAMARLFFPNVFPDVGKMVYVDMDTIFLNDLHHLWQHAYKMNKAQMIAGAPEVLHPHDIRIITRKRGYPLNVVQCMNSGVLIFDTKKMVEFGWYQFILQTAKTFLNILKYPDQDLFRLFIWFHPDKFYLLSCEYHLNTVFCRGRVPCSDAEKHGISVIHGYSQGYSKHGEFTAIWKIFKEHNLAVDSKMHLISVLKNAFSKDLRNRLCKTSTNVTFNNIYRMLADA